MKRDMCVPFWWAGSPTNMSIEATAGCGPRAEAIVTGWRIARTPTC